MGRCTDMEVDIQQKAAAEAEAFMEKLHALNPRPSEEEAYDLLNNSGIGFDWPDGYEPDLEITEVIYLDDWDKDWHKDASIRASQQWDKIAKQWKVFPIVKYWLDVTMHNKYAPGGVGYYQAKADFHQESKNVRKRAREE